jgi:hypothetical protein
MGDPIRIGVQGADGRLRQQQLDPSNPLNLNGVQVSVDAQGQVTVRGTDKNETYTAYDGAGLNQPGNRVLGIEGNGEPLYLAIPNGQNVRIEGGGGNDDYTVNGSDQFSRGVSIHDLQGNNWVTRIGSKVSGDVSVADNQVEALRRDQGGLNLVPSGENGGSATGQSISGFFGALWSYLTERIFK